MESDPEAAANQRGALNGPAREEERRLTTCAGNLPEFIHEEDATCAGYGLKLFLADRPIGHAGPKPEACCVALKATASTW